MIRAKGKGVGKYECPICGRRFATAQGRRGHMSFVHGMCRQTPAVKAIRYLIERAKKEREAKKREKEQLKREIAELKRQKTLLAIELAERLREEESEGGVWLNVGKEGAGPTFGSGF